MAEAIKKEFADIDVQLVDSSGGAFEVRQNGKMIFSKLQKGRFPETDEVIRLLKD